MSELQSNAYSDVVELCALLQCLGFHIKSLETADSNNSHDGGTQTVIINCQASGFHVIMESSTSSCSCPMVLAKQNSGFWEVSGVTGGKPYNKECGSTILGALPKTQRERLTKQLQEIVHCIKEHNESEADKPKEGIGNKSASMLELKTPEKQEYNVKRDTPTRYRSLDTLATDAAALPAPGPLKRDDHDVKRMQVMCKRQSTYTLSFTPGSAHRRKKTSSPIQSTSNSVLEGLMTAQKNAEELRNILSNVIREYTEDTKLDSSMSSLVALDVSKISVLKGPEVSKPQFASSPNLSGLGKKEDFSKRLKRVESASTSNLAPKSSGKDGKISKLRRLSPNLFKQKNSPNVSKNEKEKSVQENKSSKLNSLFKSNSVDTRPKTPEVGQNLKNKFTHVRSTIPRPSAKKE